MSPARVWGQRERCAALEQPAYALCKCFGTRVSFLSSNEGLGHCGTCHTSGGVASEGVDVDGKNNLYLSGTELDGTSPINLRGNTGDSLGRWSTSEVAELLRPAFRGHQPHGGSGA
jgi:hypothetical protein